MRIADRKPAFDQYVEATPEWRPIDPQVPAGEADAYLRASGIPVWAIIARWNAVAQDAQCVATEYATTVDEIHAALAYYREHAPAIDARISRNSR
jgi:uncharacterized protein (DUF433 family)